MYAKAPISGLINDHRNFQFTAEGATEIRFTPQHQHCHTAGSLHGSGYFKLLDDASFFAAQAQTEDSFLFTVSFNTYLVRAVVPGTELVARGVVKSRSRSLTIAEATIHTAADGKLVASGSGTFHPSPVKLADLKSKLDKID
ncbi:hypothetical protein TeGR_g4096 [Tetraparma gracilis]|uniref:Thioesterase domain-containing protein n=1 Tax=Tetraparma gracilis TaxID=2962635 RepID=A0ABQ6N364_9STRA|nr:hypothetical protein TeGR_g4096 [Tetraparma gracilis]